MSKVQYAIKTNPRCLFQFRIDFGWQYNSSLHNANYKRERKTIINIPGSLHEKKQYLFRCRRSGVKMPLNIFFKNIFGTWPIILFHFHSTWTHILNFKQLTRTNAILSNFLLSLETTNDVRKSSMHSLVSIHVTLNDLCDTRRDTWNGC